MTAQRSLRGRLWRLPPVGAPAPPLQRLLEARSWSADALGEPPFGDPLLLPDMGRAVARLREAAGRSEPVLVFGDYDVDGLCATALMTRTLQGMGARVQAHVPDRAGQGYGLNVNAIAASRVSLVVAVDNGVSAVAEAAWCATHGIDLIVVDHHLPGPERPRAVAVVNPHDPASRYPFADLCGAGVAWRLACALGQVAEEDVDLAALGTVADVMPLVGENRSLVRAGLRRLNAGRGRPGLQAVLGEGPFTARDLGFRAGPRLNAPGRMGDPAPALDLLLAATPDRVHRHLQELEAANAARREAQAAVAAAAAERVQPQAPVVFAAGEDWPVGVLGLVASRLCEETGRPACVCGRVGERWRGSLRTPAGADAVALLSACAAHLDRFGGHSQAAGFECGDPASLEAALMAAAAGSGGAPGPAEVPLDGELAPEELTLDLAHALSALQPHGAGNPAPRFLLRGATVSQVRTVGREGSHLKAVLGGHDAVGFGLGYAVAGMGERSRWDACIRPRVDRFRGRERLQLEIDDLRPATGDWSDFLAAFPDRDVLVAAYHGLRRLAGQGPLPPGPLLAQRLQAATRLPLATTRAAARIFAELGLVEHGELRRDRVELGTSVSFRLAAGVRRAIIL